MPKVEKTDDETKSGWQGENDREYSLCSSSIIIIFLLFLHSNEYIASISIIWVFVYGGVKCA